MKDTFWSNKEELFTGFCLQLPLWQITKLWTVPIMLVCAVLWRLGGWSKGNKLYRRLGVPLVVCGASMLFGVSWTILLAVPFMVWLAPSYGEGSQLFKVMLQWFGDSKRADFFTRIITYLWYWLAFGIALSLR